MDRLFQVLDTNTNGSAPLTLFRSFFCLQNAQIWSASPFPCMINSSIEVEEFLSAMYVIWYGNREHKMRCMCLPYIHFITLYNTH
jgi:hypothetical protein